MESLREVMAGRRDVQLALLFGSRARGRGSAASDVDLAVLAPGVDLFALAAELTLAAGVEVDVVDLEAAGHPLRKAILRDGRVVHEGVRGAVGRWRARTLSEVELDDPGWVRMRDAYLRHLARGAGRTDG